MLVVAHLPRSVDVVEPSCFSRKLFGDVSTYKNRLSTKTFNEIEMLLLLVTCKLLQPVNKSIQWNQNTIYSSGVSIETACQQKHSMKSKRYFILWYANRYSLSRKKHLIKPKCFLVGDTQLYKRLCPSVRRLVGWSVRRSVDTSQKVRKWAF